MRSLWAHAGTRRTGSRPPTPSTPSRSSWSSSSGPLIAAGIATASTPPWACSCAPASTWSRHRLRDGPGVRAAVPDVERGTHARRGARRTRHRDRRRCGRLRRRSRSAHSRSRCRPSPRTRARAAPSGPLITVWSLGSLVGGLWYGSARLDAHPLDRRLLIVLALLASGARRSRSPGLHRRDGVPAGDHRPGARAARSRSRSTRCSSALAPAGTSTEAYSWHIVGQRRRRRRSGPRRRGRARRAGDRCVGARHRRDRLRYGVPARRLVGAANAESAGIAAPGVRGR